MGVYVCMCECIFMFIGFVLITFLVNTFVRIDTCISKMKDQTIIQYSHNITTPNYDSQK